MTFNTVFSIVLMIFYVVAFFMAFRMYKESDNIDSCNIAVLYWLLNVSIFWIINTGARLIFGYQGGSPIFTQWSRIIYLQAVLSIIGIYIVRKRNVNQ